MEKIARHIETLLRRHDYVIVPDFGGFVLQNQSAVILSEQITPPLTTVSFNPLLNISDGLLAIEISRAENISFRQAVLEIEEGVHNLKAKLKSDKKAECGNLGVLTYNSDEKIIFVPSSGINFLPSNYGLGEVHISPLLKNTEPEKRQFTISLPSTAKIVRYTAAAMLAAGLIIFSPKINNQNEYADLNPVNLLTATTENTTSEVVAQSSFSNQKTVSTNTAADSEKAKFHVVVASLGSMKIAEKYCAELEAENYSKVHIIPSTKVYRVSIESFSSKDAAIATMEQLRKTSSQFADAWVLCE